MATAKVEPKFLEIAIQTVLLNYKGHLDTMVSDCDFEMLDEIAKEITRRAVKFQTITDTAVRDNDVTSLQLSS